MEYYKFIDKETGDEYFWRVNGASVLRVINVDRDISYVGNRRPGMILITKPSFEYLKNGYKKVNGRPIFPLEIDEGEFNKGLAKARESLMI